MGCQSRPFTAKNLDLSQAGLEDVQLRHSVASEFASLRRCVLLCVVGELEIFGDNLFGEAGV